MRLASFSVTTAVGEQTRIGVVAEEDSYIDITAGYASLLAEDGRSSPLKTARAIVPPSMVDFLENGDEALDAARRVRDALQQQNTEAWNGHQIKYNKDEIDLLSPLPQPVLLRDAMVYREHVENSFGGDIPDVWYEIPIYYKGNHKSIVHPNSDIVWPSYSDEMDYELELAAVIGKKGRDISKDEASDYIAGYTIFNDFSARDMQFKEMEMNLGPAKGKDFANGFGPYLTTTDDIDVQDIQMTARVNGDVWSEGSPGTMHHTFEDIVAHVSDSETIYPGEIIGSGTVGNGCGLELGKSLDDGDVVDLEVEEIGTLRHRFVQSDENQS